MARSSNKFDVYLEAGKKRTFAGAVEWPGWCRSGKDEASALKALFDYGERYARVLRAADLDFSPPASASDFTVAERLEGNSTTDFGAPALAPSADSQPVDEAQLQRFQELLIACWKKFDASRRSAAGRELRKGPRGGGREIEAIVRHVIEADRAYLGKIGAKLRINERDHPETKLDQTRQAILTGLAASTVGDLPAQGPRGSVYWSPRYFVRRSAWHVLDHAWEIEDRLL
ncbi:MAG: hypothetical protein ACM3QS_09105 [Bacteroidota bacterium]